MRTIELIPQEYFPSKLTLDLSRREWGEGLLSEINRDGQTEVIEDESHKMFKP